MHPVGGAGRGGLLTGHRAQSDGARLPPSRRGLHLREEFDNALTDFEQALALDPHDEGARRDHLQAQTLQLFALLKKTWSSPES